MQKKLIGFEDSLFESVNEYAEKYGIPTFTEAIRRLIEIGLKHKDEHPTTDTEEQIKNLTEKVEKLSWWTTDDNTSRLGNLEFELGELTKKVNILIKTSQLFRGHINNREIHLQD